MEASLIAQYLMPTPELESSLRFFAAGAFAGVSSVFFTYPLELIRVRLAYETHHAAMQRVSLAHTIRVIYNEGSPAASSAASSLPARRPGLFERWPALKFYRGFSVSVLGMVPYAGTSFVVYGRMRRLAHEYIPRADRHRTLVDLASGAAAGACSQTASYPFEVIRRRMQVGGLLRPDRMIGFGETVRAIYAKSGWRGFFVGLSIGYLKIVPMTALRCNCGQQARADAAASRLGRHVAARSVWPTRSRPRHAHAQCTLRTLKCIFTMPSIRPERP